MDCLKLGLCGFVVALALSKPGSRSALAHPSAPMAALTVQRLGPDMVYRVQDENVTLTHLYAHALPLAVFCRHSAHRALIEQERVDAREGNMKSLLNLRFHCRSCGKRGDGTGMLWLYLFHQRSEADDFAIQEQTREP